MNGRVAKRLRREARDHTVGHPDVAYLRNEKTNEIVLGACTRKVYKFLKKQYKGKNTNGMVAATRSSTQSS